MTPVGLALNGEEGMVQGVEEVYCDLLPYLGVEHDSCYIWGVLGVASNLRLASFLLALGRVRYILTDSFKLYS